MPNTLHNILKYIRLCSFNLISVKVCINFKSPAIKLSGQKLLFSYGAGAIEIKTIMKLVTTV